MPFRLTTLRSITPTSSKRWIPLSINFQGEKLLFWVFPLLCDWLECKRRHLHQYQALSSSYWLNKLVCLNLRDRRLFVLFLQMVFTRCSLKWTGEINLKDMGKSFSSYCFGSVATCGWQHFKIWLGGNDERLVLPVCGSVDVKSSAGKTHRSACQDLLCAVKRFNTLFNNRCHVPEILFSYTLGSF